MLFPVAATIIGVLFASCGPSGPKSAVIPVVMILGPPAIVHYGRGIAREWEFEGVGKKGWPGTRALDRPVASGLRIWAPPKCVWKYIPNAEMAEVLSGGSVAQGIKVTPFEALWGSTAHTRTILATATKKALVTLTKIRGVITTTTHTTEVTATISITTTVTATATPQPTQTNPKNTGARPTRTPVDVICELLGRRFEGLVLAIVRIALLWCVRAIFWVARVLFCNAVEAVHEYWFDWLGFIRLLHRHSHCDARDLVILHAMFMFASFVYGWNTTMEYAQNGGDVAIVELLTPYVMEAVKWVFWAYTWAEMCFFLQGMSVAILSCLVPRTLESRQRKWAIEANAHFGMAVGAGQTCFSLGSLRYPLVAGYTSWCIYIAGGLAKTPMYGAWSWVGNPGYEGVWLLDFFKCLFPLTTT